MWQNTTEPMGGPQKLAKEFTSRNKGYNKRVMVKLVLARPSPLSRW